MDRISNLPESLIEQILKGLPQIERVRTSVLSTRWRFLWSQHSSLLLNRQFHRSIRVPLSDYLGIINNLGQQYDKSRVHHLSLFLPDEEDYYGEDVSLNYDTIARTFDRLINSFFLPDGTSVHRLFIGRPATAYYFYIVPPCIFSSASITRLTHLQLHGEVRFSPPSSFQGFPNLVNLEIHHQDFACGDAISRFVSSCPNIQKLVLQHLSLLKSSSNLTVDAPKLGHLRFHGGFDWLFLKNVVNTKVLEIKMKKELPEPWGSMHADINTFFDGMPNLEKITLGDQFPKLLANHTDCIKVARADGLRSLAFIKLRTPDVLVYVWNSIRNFQYLTELTISMHRKVEKDGGEIRIKDADRSGYVLESLGRVYLEELDGSNLEMELIECLLCSTPNLRIMSIGFNNTLSENTLLKLFCKITKFSRASNKAEFDFPQVLQD